MPNTPNVIADLYGALAAVAAITTALQTPVALQCFTECEAFLKKVKSAKQKRNDTAFVPSERRDLLVRHLILNAPAILVNVLVIGTWGYVGLHYRPTGEAKWLYILPWYALGIAALFLIMVVLYALFTLFSQRRAVRVILAALAVILFLVIIGVGIYVNP